MKTRLILCGLLSGALTAFAAEQTNLPSATALAPPPTHPETPPPSATPETALVERLKATQVSPAAREIVQLFEAGTDSAVIQSYVETSTTPYNLRAEDLIYLHERGVPSAVVTAMLRRAAKLREQNPSPAAATPGSSTAPVPAVQVPAQPTVAIAPAPAVSHVYVVPSSSPTYVYSAYPSVAYTYPSYRYGYSVGYPSCYGSSVFYSRPSYGYSQSYNGYNRSYSGYSHRLGGYGFNHVRHGR